MALNYSHRPVFQGHVSEDNLVAPMRTVNGCLVEGIPENSTDVFGWSWHMKRHVDDCLKYVGNRVDSCGSPESTTRDIIDMLPSDPFGMNVSTTFTTSITRLLEDLELGYGVYARNEVGGGGEDYGLFAGLNLICKNAAALQSFSESGLFDNKHNTVSQVYGSCKGKFGDSYDNHDFGSSHNSVDVFGFDNESTVLFPPKIEETQEATESCSAGDPHEAFLLALDYLEVPDLLSVERVCKSLCSTVQSEPHWWRSIHIDQPLNEKITDDILLQLTSRAQGNLQCLSLVECTRITDDGLRRVLDSNPRLTKLCVPRCQRISIEGIVNIVKAFKSSRDAQGIKHLRIGGLYGVTYKYFKELKLLLGLDGQTRQVSHEPHFYQRGNIYLLCDDELALDIEVCPQCQKLRLVYDCPAQGCRSKDFTKACRACIFCIARCVQCGRCISDIEYEETFCLEFLCSDCFNQLPKCEDSQDEEVFSTNHAFEHPLNYDPCFRG